MKQHARRTAASSVVSVRSRTSGSRSVMLFRMAICDVSESYWMSIGSQKSDFLKESLIPRSMLGTNSRNKMERLVEKSLAQEGEGFSCCTAKRTRRACEGRCAKQAYAS